MARTPGAFPFLGHGGEADDDDDGDGGASVWVVFRDPVNAEAIAGDLPAPFALRFAGDRVVEVGTDDEPPGKREAAALERWLAACHARQPIAFAALDGASGGDAWHDASRKQIATAILPWFVETWRAAPAFRSGQAAAALACVIAALRTKKRDTVELAATAVELALDQHEAIARELAAHLGALIGRLDEPELVIAALAPALQLRVWTRADLVADPVAVIAALDALGDAARPFGPEIAQLAGALDAPELHLRALELDGAPLASFYAVLDRDGVIDRHTERFAADHLEVMLHHAITKKHEALTDRCMALAVERPDAPGITANLLYATSAAGRAHESIRIAHAFVARFRANHPGRLLATLYTNILLAYGTTASCDDLARSLTEELEDLLRTDPAYFGFSGDKAADVRAGKAGHDILGSAYASAACGRAVMGDGAAAARWLAFAKEHRFADLAVCANLVCFQNLRDDPDIKPVVAEIARLEVERLEASNPGKDVHALFSLALTLHNAGHLDAAERYYDKVLALEPRHPDALNNLGNVHGVRGDIPRAVAFYDKAIARVPKHPLYHACRAWALARAARWDEALASGDRSIALDPTQPAPYFPRGAAHLGRGDRAKAAADFKRGAQLNPSWRSSEKDDPWFAEMAALIDAT